jgi:hypothetical protein
MDKDSDLLPWILGGLMIATMALAIAIGSTNRIAPRNLQGLSRTTAQPLPAVVLTPVSAPSPTVPAAQMQTVTPTMEPGGQIWECTIDGQKTFSNNPCGEKSSLREIGPINTMDPTPILPPIRSYESPSSYQPEYPYPSTQESADNSYPVLVGIPFNERRRPDHPHRPYKHDRGPSPR